MRPLPTACVARLAFPSLRVAVFLFLWLLCTGVGRAQQPVANASPIPYSQGDPTPEEQYLLERLNRARLDPVGEGQRLAAWLRSTAEGQSAARQFGVDPDQVARDFATLPAVPPLVFNADLIAAARGHSADLAAHGGQAPHGDPDAYWDGSQAGYHIDASGYQNAQGNSAGFVGEDAFAGVADLDTIHAGYLIDWGNPDLGHRKQEMSSVPQMDVVGLGLATIPGPAPYMDTEFYCNGAVGAAFLTGVVYTDTSGNSLYDVGEGVVGVMVTVNGGSFYAVTSASGGYALPLTRGDGTNLDDALTGTLAVHMTGFADGSTRDGTVVVPTVTVPGGYQWPLSVKWDAAVSQKAATPAPADPAQASIAGGGSVAKGGKLLLVISRPADQSDLSQPLTLAYTLKGSAVAGVDYQPLRGSVTIPAGKRRTRLTIQALDYDIANRPAGPWTLQFRLKGVKGAQGKTSVTFP